MIAANSILLSTIKKKFKKRSNLVSVYSLIRHLVCLFLQKHMAPIDNYRVMSPMLDPKSLTKVSILILKAMNYLIESMVI